MTYQIDIPKAWRPDGRQLVHAGIYRVPEDIPVALAAKAESAGVAARLVDAVAASEFPVVEPRWQECIVAATGPSLSKDVAGRCVASGLPIVAVNDAYRLFPDADVLYACDAKWWSVHKGVPSFKGERWSSHGIDTDDKRDIAKQYGMRLVEGREAEGFSLDPHCIHYGSNSGFQAINLAILFGAKRILLVGFDMSFRGKSHFFGEHPKGLIRQRRYENFIPHFVRAAERLPDRIKIINCTPGSALQCFPMMDLADALAAT